LRDIQFGSAHALVFAEYYRKMKTVDKTVPVWDIVVRVTLWTLVLGVLGAALTEDFLRVHEWLGYAALTAVSLRILWGLAGTRYARFSQFVRSRRDTLRYATSLAAFREPRYLGHNPLGGWMIVVLMMMVMMAGLTGWLAMDVFDGAEWMEEVHEAFANGLLLLIILHVAGVIFASLHHGENLVKAMFSGRKRALGPRDIA
jgi:cytochrome b